MLDKLKSIMGRKSLTGWLNMGAPEVLIGRSYSGQAQVGYSNPYVYKCINVRAKAMGSIPWLLYRGEKELEDHPLLSLLSRPNPRDGGSRFIQDLVGYKLLNGNAYIYAPPVTRTYPRELYALRPDMTQLIEGDAQHPVAGYQFSGRHGSMHIAPEDILHWKSFNPLDELRGMSPLLAAALSVQMNSDARAWDVALLQNGGKSSGTVTTDGQLTDKQRKALREQLKAKHGGPRNAGKIMVMEGGMHWEQMGMTAVEMDWIEGLKLSSREICIALDVPPELVGDSANKTYSNYQEARKALYQETVDPDMCDLRDELNRWLVPKFGGDLYLDFDKDSIDALAENRNELWTRLNATSWLTINEKRAAAGYEPIGAEGDVILVPATNLPLDMAASPFSPFEEPQA